MTFEKKDWIRIIDNFRSFGGEAENIERRRGEYGLGLFPIEQTKPIKLLVPSHLLVRANDVGIVDGELVILESADYQEEYKQWFKEYQSNYSWGVEGRKSVQELTTNIESQHSDVKSLLRQVGLYQPKKFSDPGQKEQYLLNKFLASRCIRRGQTLLIMPLVELVNHSPQAQNWLSKDGKIGMSGLYKGEILVNYSNTDSIRRFFNYGFNCEEHMAFSLNVTFKHKGRIVRVIGGGGRYWFEPPLIEENDKNISVKQPLLGNRKYPKLSRYLFQEGTKKIECIDGKELFEQICLANVQNLVQIIKLLGNKPSNMGQQIVQACLNQLNILSYHVGTRSLE